MRIAIVTGADGGLGKLICDAIDPHYEEVVALDKRHLDLTDSVAIYSWGNQFRVGQGDQITLINCAGLASINWNDNLSEAEWDNVFAVNVKAPFLMATALQGKLVDGTILNISSRAARFPMRCSLAYNASKAALDMATRQMARELYPISQTVVFGVAPNKLADTPMSRWVDEQVCRVRGWTPEAAHQYELKDRVVKEDTPPETLAEFIGFLLSSRARHKHLNGCIINYGD